MFSLTVKRENILLPIVLPLLVLYLRYTRTNSKPFAIGRPWWFLLSTTLTIIFSFQLHLYQTQNGEIALLKKFPFTAAEVISLFPVFVSSFANVQWYGGAFILVLAGIFAAFRRKTLELIPLSLFAAYVTLYAFHMRGYYEMQSGTTDSRAALRFSMSLMSLWSILAGLGAAFVLDWFRLKYTEKKHRALANWMTSLIVVLIVGVTFFTTQCLREDVVEDEFRVRVEPSLGAVRTATKNGMPNAYIITLEPLIVQMYAKPTVNVISLEEMDDEVIEEIESHKGAIDLLYLDKQMYRNPVDAERYMSQLACLNQFKRSTLADEPTYSAIKLSRGPVAEPHTWPSNHK